MMNRLKKMIQQWRELNWKGKSVVVTILLLVLWGGWSAYLHFQPQKEDALPASKADPRVVCEGIVVPVRYAVLSLPINGVVGELKVKEGERVTAGQLLLRLTSDDLSAKVTGARADQEKMRALLQQTRTGSRDHEVAMKRAAMTELEAAYLQAEKDWQRMEALGQQQAVARQEEERSKTAYLKAKAEWERAAAEWSMAVEGSRQEAITAAEAEHNSAAASVGQAKALQEQAELRAPFEGTVAYLDQKVGEYAAAGTALVRLGEMSEWRIQTDDLTEMQIAKVREGARVMMTFDALPGLELPGTVQAIRPFGEKKRGDITYTVYIVPERHEPLLKWSMTAIVKIDPAN